MSSAQLKLPQKKGHFFCWNPLWWTCAYQCVWVRVTKLRVWLPLVTLGQDRLTITRQWGLSKRTPSSHPPLPSSVCFSSPWWQWGSRFATWTPSSLCLFAQSPKTAQHKEKMIADGRGGVHCIYFSKLLCLWEHKLILCPKNSRVGVDATWHVIPFLLNQSPHSCSPHWNFSCCCPSNGQHLGGLSGPRSLLLALPLSSGSPPSAPQVHKDSRSQRSWPGSPARMEGDVMDKVEATAPVCDFDPISGSIPATKVEITVSCRWVQLGAGAAVAASAFCKPRASWSHFVVKLSDGTLCVKT